MMWNRCNRHRSLASVSVKAVGWCEHMCVWGDTCRYVRVATSTWCSLCRVWLALAIRQSLVFWLCSRTGVAGVASLWFFLGPRRYNLGKAMDYRGFRLHTDPHTLPAHSILVLREVTRRSKRRSPIAASRARLPFILTLGPASTQRARNRHRVVPGRV